MTREIALHCMKSASELERELCEECPIYGQTGCDHCYEDALQYVIATLEQEPTTKNCRTCRNFGSHHGICEICKDNKCWTEIESTTKNDLGVDCISRKAAEDITWQDPSYTDPLNILTEVRDKIRELPSVTPQEPKTGHWISHREHCENLGLIPSGLGAYKWCSNCDCGIDVREWHRNHYNYCPNCGADMREVEE